MIWEEVEEKYGKKLADKMKKSKMLCGITMSLRPDGKCDIPEGDIHLAWKDVTGKYIHPLEWD